MQATDPRHVAALTALAEAGIPVDVQELLVHTGALAKALAAGSEKMFGPYAYLNGHRALSEDSWTVEDDPIGNDVEYFSIPLFAKVDVKFPVTYGEPDAAAYEAYADELRALATDTPINSNGGDHG